MTNPRRRNFAVITLRWHDVDVGVAQHRALPAQALFCRRVGVRTAVDFLRQPGSHQKDLKHVNTN